MRLQDEYIQRHHLKYKPIYHIRNANIVLKLKVKPPIILNIRWHEPARRPGYYVFDYLSPNHNGYLDGNYFIQLGEKHYYQYDEYASFITRWSRNLDAIPVKSGQIKLAVWEMFLYCFDGWIAEYNLEDTMFPAADIALSNEERCNNIDSFLYHFESSDPTVSDIYNAEFRQYEYDYANWLVELIMSHQEAKNAKV